MMFIVTDTRMGEFSECHQASWPLVGSYLVSENWPLMKRSLQIIHKVSEPQEVCSDYLYLSLGLQMPSFYLFILTPRKAIHHLPFHLSETLGMEIHCDIS